MKDLHTDPEFQAFYQRELRPLESQFEGHRTGARKGLVYRGAGAIAGVGVAVALGVWLNGGDVAGTWMYFVSILLAGIFLAIWAALPLMVHMGRVKIEVMPRLVSFFGDLTYHWSPTLALQQFERSGALPRYNKSFLEDLVQGTRGGVPFALMEIRLSYERRVRSTGSSSSSTRTDTVFRGLLASFCVGDEYPGRTVVGSRGGFTGYSEIRDDSGLRPLAVEDERFEVYVDEAAGEANVASDEVRERLSQLTHLFRAEHLVASFHGDRVLLLIAHEGDYFEMSTRKKTDLAQAAEKVGEQLQRFLDLVDHLHLTPAAPGSEPIKLGGDEMASALAESAESEDDPYAVAGWGCLGVFFLWMGLAAIGGFMLRGKVDIEWLLPTTAGAGLLAAVGLFQVQRFLKNPSVGGLVLAVLLIGAAAGVIALAA